MSEPSPAAPTGARLHVLYVAWGFPPSRGAGMYRALATANAFAAEGWDVTVLTATRDTFERLTGSDPAAEAAVDPAVRVERIPFDPDRGEEDLARWSRSRVLSPLLWNYLRWLRSSAAFPEGGYGHWRAPLIDAAERIHAERPVDLVVGTANPNVDFAPGEHLHRAHGVPYVMDYRDGWSLDVYTGQRSMSRRSRAGRIESRMLRHVVEAWFVNEPIRAWHAREHPSSRVACTSSRTAGTRSSCACGRATASAATEGSPSPISARSTARCRCARRSRAGDWRARAPSSSLARDSSSEAGSDTSPSPTPTPPRCSSGSATTASLTWAP